LTPGSLWRTMRSMSVGYETKSVKLPSLRVEPSFSQRVDQAFEVWRIGRGTPRNPEHRDANLSDFLRFAVARQCDDELGV
jgi:hypothetical protein